MRKKIISWILLIAIFFGSFPSYAKIEVRGGNYVSEKDLLEGTYPSKNQADIELRPIITLSLKKPYVLSDRLSNNDGKKPDTEKVLEEFKANTFLDKKSIGEYFDEEGLKRGVRLVDGSREIVLDFRYAKSSLLQNKDYALEISMNCLNLKNEETRTDLVNYILASTYTNRSKISINFKTGMRSELSPKVSVKADGKEIFAGDKGINPAVKEIEANVNNPEFYINPSYLNGEKVLGVKLFYKQDGVEKELTKAKFYCEKSGDIPKKVKIQINGGGADSEQLMENTHYYINFPKDFFQEKGGDRSKEVKFNFATGSYDGVVKDIIIPKERVKGQLIDFEKDEITLFFLDEIVLNPSAVLKPEYYFSVEENPVDGGSGNKIDVNRFSFSAIGNKLIIKKKANVGGSTSPDIDLNDTKSYKISIEPNAVYLLSSAEYEKYDGLKIYNGYVEETCKNKNYILEVLADWTKRADPKLSDLSDLSKVKDIDRNAPHYPLTEWPKVLYDSKGNVSIEVGERRLTRNPMIKIRFSKPVKVRDLSKIKLTSDAETFALDKAKSVFAEGDSLYFDLGNLQKGSNLLRFDTAYKVMIEEGALEHSGNDYSITNPQIKLSFITSRETIGFKRHWSSIVEKTLSKSMDDLTKVCDSENPDSSGLEWKRTQLKPDGRIYLTFYDNEDRKDDQIKDFLKIAVSKEGDLSKYFRLYKIPKAVKKMQYDSNGYSENSDLLIEYDSNGNSVGGAEEEVPIESVELKDNAIAIKPKHNLLPYNAYRIRLDDLSLIRVGSNDTKEESEPFRTLSEPINDIIWTAADGTVKSLSPVRISDEKEIKNEKSPLGSESTEGESFSYAEELSSGKDTAFVLGGTRKYSPSSPIRIPMNDRIVINPCLMDREWTELFVLEYGYYTVKDNETTNPYGKKSGRNEFIAQGTIPISKIGIEERVVGNGKEKRSTLIVYPSGTLKSGMDHRLRLKLYNPKEDKKRNLKSDKLQSPIKSRAGAEMTGKDGKISEWTFYFSVEGSRQSQDGAGIYEFELRFPDRSGRYNEEYQGKVLYKNKKLYYYGELRELLKIVEDSRTEAVNKGEYYFKLPKVKIYGFNFTENIDKLELVGDNGKTITIDNGKKVNVHTESGEKLSVNPLKFDNTSMIEGYIPIEALRQMIWEEGENFARKNMQGIYDVKVSFRNSGTATGKSSPEKFFFGIVDRPYAIDSYPKSGAQYLDVETMKPGKATSVYILNQKDRTGVDSGLSNALRDILSKFSERIVEAYNNYVEEYNSSNSDKLSTTTGRAYLDFLVKELLSVSKSSSKINTLKDILNTPYTAENVRGVEGKIASLIDTDNSITDRDKLIEERLRARDKNEREKKFFYFYKFSKQEQREDHNSFSELFKLLENYQTLNTGGVLKKDKETSEEKKSDVAGNLPQDTYFIQLKYKDFLNTIAAVDKAIEGVVMYDKKDQSKTNMVDTSSSVHLEKGSDGNVVFWVPLSGKPEAGKTYEVVVEENKLSEYRLDGKYGMPERYSRLGNYKTVFEFSTNIIPKHERLYEGSVPEDYNPAYPIAMDMDVKELERKHWKIFDTTSVYFRDVLGRIFVPDRIVIRKSDEDKDALVRLYIFLPANPRLQKGLYDIILSNTKLKKSEYSEELVYGVFSVVPRGVIPPNEVFWFKRKDDKLEVEKLKNKSDDTVRVIKPDSLDKEGVKTSYDNFEIDLEKLTGSSSQKRLVEFPSGQYQKLTVSSKEGRAEFSSVSKNSLKKVCCNLESRLKDKTSLFLYVGEVSQGEQLHLKKKLKGNTIKSKFFSISDENFDFELLTVSLKYSGEADEKYKIYRYDEEERIFKALETKLDSLTKRAVALSDKGGIFVVVKER